MSVVVCVFHAEGDFVVGDVVVDVEPYLGVLDGEARGLVLGEDYSPLVGLMVEDGLVDEGCWISPEREEFELIQKFLKE